MTDPTPSHTESPADPRSSRRAFLKIAGVGGAVLVAGCDTDEPDPVDPGAFGTLTGTVTGDGGGPIPGVTISFASDDITRTATTGDDGVFTIERLPAGTYTVLADVDNFERGMQEGVTIGAGGSTTVDFTLTPGGDVVIDFADDFGVLNYAYALEQLEAAFYAQVVATPYDGMSDDEMGIMQDLAAHEAIHRDFLRAAIEAAGGTINNRNLIPPLTPSFENVDFSNRTQVLQTAQTLEDTGVGAYNGAGALLSDTGNGPTYLLIAGKIVSVEGRHASVISNILADDPSAISATGAINEQGLDEALTPTFVLAAIDSFIVNDIEARNL
jgi:hypothetical protein